MKGRRTWLAENLQFFVIVFYASVLVGLFGFIAWQDHETNRALVIQRENDQRIAEARFNYELCFLGLPMNERGDLSAIRDCAERSGLVRVQEEPPPVGDGGR